MEKISDEMHVFFTATENGTRDRPINVTFVSFITRLPVFLSVKP